MRNALVLAALFAAASAVAAAPAEPAYTIRVDQVLGASGADYFFGDITSVVEDSRGDVYVADNSRMCVHKLGPDGAYLARLGQAGDGPADLMRNFALAIDDSDRIWVAGMGSRVEVVDTDWKPLASFQRTHPASWARSLAVFPDGGCAIAAEGTLPRTTVDLYRPDHAYFTSTSRAFTFGTGLPHHLESPFVGGVVAVGTTGPTATLYYAQLAPYLLRTFTEEGTPVDSTTVGGADFVPAPAPPEVDGDRVSYRGGPLTSGIAVLDDGTMAVSCYNPLTGDAGTALYCLYDAGLQFLGSVTDPHRSRLAGRARDGAAWLTVTGGSGTEVWRVRFVKTGE